MERLAFDDHRQNEQHARRFRNRVLRVLARKAVAEFRAWRQKRGQALHRAVASRELHSLSDRMLRDIGLRRSDLNPMG